MFRNYYQWKTLKTSKTVNRYYFTFGCGIDTLHRNCYHVEVAEDFGKAREQMIDKFGTDRAFQYTEDEKG